LAATLAPTRFEDDGFRTSVGLNFHFGLAELEEEDEED